ncbi:MAG: ComF family protein [Gemmatimonadales bacterium]
MISALERLLLPAECLVCHGLLADERADDLVCPVCRSRWRAVRPPWCERCGQPEPHFGPCRLCREWPAVLATVRSAVWLDAGARATVHALKYGGLPRIAVDIAAGMARLLPTPPVGARLVPIPLGARRLRTRGYNQSLWIARVLAHRWHLSVAGELLTRTRDTRTQTALTPAARLANVAGAFRVRIGDCGLRIGLLPSDSAIHNSQSALVLVDDVFTTGATLAEAARALEQSGFTTVTAVTFGRATIPDFS